jgi:murein DD-endopeptidase MepM/ murein hydrolase activator NlpD
VQRPGPVVTYGPYYAQFVPEARANVAAWEGVSTSTPTATPAATTAGQWTQGSATTSESVWDMGQRLMQEIAWRMFVGPDDKVWLVPDEWLFQRPAAATLHEFEGAVDTIDWTIDAGRRSSPAAPNRQPMDACSVKAFDTWNVQPGSVVQLAGEGPANGKWLVMDWERDAFKPDSTITLGAPMVQLAAPTVATTTAPGDSTSTTPATPRQFPVGTALVQPIPQGPYQQSNGGIHSTEGLSGRSYNGGTWPASDAIDFFAIAGAPVVAMENGKIVRFSGHDPRLGPTEGGGGPFGWTIYLLGDSGSTYFITHLGTRIIAVGQTVKAGQQIGTVGNYYSWTRTPNHTHVGVYPAASGHPDIHDLNSAPRAARA